MSVPVKEVLIRAMINEQDGREFYLAAAERLSDVKGQEMFRGLASDETEHLRIIRAEYDRVTEGQAFLDLDAARAALPANPALKLFPERSQLAAMLAGVTDDQSALRVALDFELKGYEMYRSVAEDESDPNACEVFQHLVKQENQHYQWIQKTLQFLTQKGFWFFQDEEKPIFE